MTGRVYEIRKSTSFFWLLFSAFWGLLADYGCGMIYFYVCSNFVLGVSVGWKLVFINCFLLTVGEDFILCILAAVFAKRLIPILGSLQSKKKIRVGLLSNGSAGQAVQTEPCGVSTG